MQPVVEETHSAPLTGLSAPNNIWQGVQTENDSSSLRDFDFRLQRLETVMWYDRASVQYSKYSKCKNYSGKSEVKQQVIDLTGGGGANLN